LTSDYGYMLSIDNLYLNIVKHANIYDFKAKLPVKKKYTAVFLNIALLVTMCILYNPIN